MATHTVTVKLSEDIYQRAEQVAQATERSVEQVVVEWIHPPSQEEPVQKLNSLDKLTDNQLIEIAQTRISKEMSHRLQELLAIQQQRPLTKQEKLEAASLVEQEDLLTLQKARAIFLLKQRDALPDNLMSVLD